MRNRVSSLSILILIIVFALGFAVVENKAQSKELSELSKLKAENFKLKAQLNTCSLTVEQSKLVDSFRKELDAKESQEFDWSSFSFKTSNASINPNSNSNNNSSNP